MSSALRNSQIWEKVSAGNVRLQTTRVVRGIVCDQPGTAVLTDSIGGVTTMNVLQSQIIPVRGKNVLVGATSTADLIVYY